LQARCDVPIDIADIIARLVLTHLGQVQAKAVEKRPIVPLQETIEAPDYRPVEMLE
jgi:hypothetical protein